MMGCENCGQEIVRRSGEWVHTHNDAPRCWPGRDFLAFPEMDEGADE